MTIRSFFFSLALTSALASTAACGSAPDDTDDSTASSLSACSEDPDAGPTQDPCAQETSESSCLKVDGCGWFGGSVQKCVHVGHLVPLTASGLPCHHPDASVPTTDAGPPNQCGQQTSESACLAVGTCGWDASQHACLYIGVVVPL